MARDGPLRTRVGKALQEVEGVGPVHVCGNSVPGREKGE